MRDLGVSRENDLNPCEPGRCRALPTSWRCWQGLGRPALSGSPAIPRRGREAQPGSPATLLGCLVCCVLLHQLLCQLLLLQVKHCRAIEHKYNNKHQMKQDKSNVSKCAY